MARRRSVVWLGVLKLSARQLRQRWLESALILLGIALGVGVLTTGQTLVTFQTVGLLELVAQTSPSWRAVTVRPAQVDVTSQFFGTQSVPAVPVTFDAMEPPVELSLADVLAVRDEVPGVALATVEAVWRQGPVVAVDDLPPPGPGQPQLLAEAVTPDEFAFRGIRFLAGGPFTWDDLLAGRPYIVLDEASARRLFPDAAPADVVGRTLTETSGSQGSRWQVIGVAAPEEGLLASFMPWAQGGDVGHGYVPAAVQPWLSASGGTYDPLATTFGAVYFTPENERLTSQLVAAIEAYFSQKYGAGRVEVRNPEVEREEAISWIQPAATALLVLAGLGLLIAAVNILNLFTARVLRRQRIIGTSMALGASRGLLFWQTASEALLLGVTGSLLGLGLASGLVSALRLFLMQQMGGGELVEGIYGSFGLSLGDALVGLGTGVALSLLFGLYPALLGSRQDPVEALRVE